MVGPQPALPARPQETTAGSKRVCLCPSSPADRALRALRARVEALFAAEEPSAAFMEEDPGEDLLSEGRGALGAESPGDVVGNYLFRHTVNYEAEYLIHTVLDAEECVPLDYGPVPHAVFGSPQIAGVGPTEDELKASGVDYAVGRASYAESTPGMARGSDQGLVKILVERASGQILAAHIVGDEASDMIHLFIAMMKKNGTLEDLLDMIFIHPALPEVARDAARDARRVLAEGGAIGA